MTKISVKNDGKVVSTFRTEDGMKITLQEQSDGRIKIWSEEDFGGSAGFGSKVDKLLEILRLFGKIDDVKKEYTDGPGGKGKISTILVFNQDGQNDSGKNISNQIKFYRTLQNRLLQVIEDLEQKSLKRLDEDMEFFCRFSPSKWNKSKKMAAATYFLREIFGLLQLEKGIKRTEIISQTKKRGLVEIRTIIAYLLRKKFGLSFLEIAGCLGEPGCPKNHATIILYCRKFKNRDGDDNFYKKESDVLALYQRAKKRYKKPEE